MKRLSLILEWYCWEELNIYCVIVQRKIIILTISCCSKNVTYFHRRNTSIPKRTRLWNVVPNTRHSALENSLQMLVVNVNNSQKMPLWHFNRPYWRMRIQNALLLVLTGQAHDNVKHGLWVCLNNQFFFSFLLSG